MNNKIILVLLTLCTIMAINGCEIKPLPVKISGQVIDTVSHSPINNMQFVFIWGGHRGYNDVFRTTHEWGSGTFNTDDNGYFEFVTDLRSSDECQFFFYDSLIGIPPKRGYSNYFLNKRIYGLTISKAKTYNITINTQKP